ncbi:hypothetical protein EZS27_008663 [termite gut metagenome]|uniref:Uncharacterized protein n=1 Tax=termite gut metagenome TaxID=433724 RepID=A0A5J4SCS2_9ZZZZ
MAEFYDISGLTYDVIRQPEWFTKAMFSGNILERGYVKILPNIKKSTKLNQINIEENLLQIDNADCGWNPTGDIKLSESILDVKTYKINMEDCIEKFESVWLSEKMKPGAEVDSLPDGLEAATLDLVGKKVNDQIEEWIWDADSAQDEDQFDGFIKVLNTSDKTIKIAGSTITKANVVGEIEKVYAAIPEAVLQNAEERVKIFVSYNTNRVLRMSLSNVNSQVIHTEFSIEGKVVYFLGIEIVPAKGISNSQMIASTIDNLIFGTDLVSDFSEIELGTFPKPNESKLWIKGRLRLGVTVAFPEEAVLYTPTNGLEKNTKKGA